MDHEFKEGRLYLRRTSDERAPIVARLARIEGQVRGIRQMIEEDRYCGDEIQQANAVTSAMREVAVLIISQHLSAGVEHALPLGRGLDRALADKFIGMYVNELTLDYGVRGRKGVKEFLDRGHAAGLLPAPVDLEFV